MKKTTRVLVALLALTLVTSCFVGGTFAKYVVSGDIDEDTARVAKFGVELTAESDIFAASYDANGSISVLANEDVVAPGTTGTAAIFSITGAPEVDVQVTATLGEQTQTVDGADIVPVEIESVPTTILPQPVQSVSEEETQAETQIESQTEAPAETTVTYPMDNYAPTYIQGDYQVISLISDAIRDIIACVLKSIFRVKLTFCIWLNDTIITDNPNTLIKSHKIGVFKKLDMQGAIAYKIKYIIAPNARLV